MIKKHLIIAALLFFPFFTSAQLDTTTRIKVNKTEVEFLYNQYFQEGNNSAVTGGKGTEKLVVYGPSLKWKRIFGDHKLDVQLGSDIISSASTDKIDFEVSSASKTDARAYTDIEYSRFFPKNNLSLNGGLGFSIESDYFSSLVYLGFEKTSRNEMQTYSGQLQIYNDDLRWGRLDEDYYRPVKLIYPGELRTREWYDVYHRNSYNLKLGFTQIVDKKNILGFFGRLSYQEGLLATPFHRIYFSDGSLAVEQLPRKRFKEALTLKWNRFIGGTVILRNTINAYADNFGILGLALENETVIKWNPRWALTPNFRFYLQKGSKYFAPINAHEVSEKYYTSDYDLSTFRSYKSGIMIQYNPFVKFDKKIMINLISIHYHHYYRSDGLQAHIGSLFLTFEF